MQKQIGSIMLVAGTCIGSGMIALPMLLSKIGIVPSVILMMLVWLLMYASSLTMVELSLQSGKGLPIGALGRKYSGKIAELIGTTSFKILSFALVAVYIHAGSSVIQKMLQFYTGISYDFNIVCGIYTLLSFLIFVLPMRYIDHVNRLIFVGLLGVIAVLIIGLCLKAQWFNLPLIAPQSDDFSAWHLLIPVVFGSFGFQGSCHSFVQYCRLDKNLLNKALLWGSFIPLIVYSIWTASSLAVIYQANPEFYADMSAGKVDVGDLVQQLSILAELPSMQLLVWWVSILAILTSLLGVGLGLFDAVKHMLPSNRLATLSQNILASIITVVPAYCIAVMIPHAFISVLSFAGMILVVIAILLPVYLFYKATIHQPNYAVLKKKWLLPVIAFAGVFIVLCEIMNLVR